MKLLKWNGAAITEPGVYADVPIRTYHGPLVPADRRSVSRSGLWRLFDKSPAHHWKESCYNPDAEEQEESEPLLFGRAAHHLLLGEANFKKHFAIRPPEFDSWRTKDAKAWRAEKTDHGFDVLIPSNIDSIRGMARGLAGDPIVRAGALNGLIEHTMIAQDPETGLWIKVRPDAIPTDSGDYTDLKSCADVTDDGLETAIGRDGLFVQGAMTRYICQLLGLPFTSFTLIFSEKTEPHCVQTRTLKEADLDLGYKAMRCALLTYQQCDARNVWPGPGGERQDAAYIEMRPYHRKRFEDRIAQMETELLS